MSFKTNSGTYLSTALGIMASRYKLNFGTAPASGEVETGNWVRSAVINLTAASLFTLTTGDITASGLPAGVTCDTSGALTGQPYECRSAQTVTFTRGVETQQVDIGVVVRSGSTSPIGNTFNADPDILPAATTTVSATTIAGLSTALQTAVDHAATAAATAGNEVVHVINYTGPDANQLLLNGSSTPATGIDHTYIIVNGNGANIRQIRWGYKRARVIWRDFTLLAWQGGGLPHPGAVYCENGNVQHCFVECKMGPWHGADQISRVGIDWGMVELNASSRLSMDRCWLAGWEASGVVTVGANDTELMMFNCMVTHVGEDVIRAFGGTTNTARVYVDGLTVAAFVTTDSRDHTDLFQTGNQAGGAYVKNIQLYNVCAILDSTRYGTTGVRQQIEGTSQSLTSEIIHIENFISIQSGISQIVTTGVNVVIDKVMSAPCPGMGVPDDGAIIRFASTASSTPPGTSSIANIIRDSLQFAGGWVGNELTVGGTDTVFTCNNTTSLAATFPSMTGAIEIHNRHAGGGAGTANASIFVPDEIDYVYHPDSIRAAVSAFYEPAAGWGNGSPDDPAALDNNFGWLTEETFTKPTATSATASTTSATISTNATDGILLVQRRDKTETANTYPAVAFGAPTRCQMRQGVCRDGSFTGPYDGGTAVSPALEWQRIPITASGTQTFTYSASAQVGDEIAFMVETYAGHISDVVLVDVT